MAQRKQTLGNLNPLLATSSFASHSKLSVTRIIQLSVIPETVVNKNHAASRDQDSCCISTQHLQHSMLTKANSVLPLLKTTMKKFLVFLFPRAALAHRLHRGSATVRRRAHSGPGQARLADQTQGFSVRKIRGSSAAQRSQLNELCLTSRFGSLLPHPPPPVSSLFVSSAWECQLPLVEDAAYSLPH